MFSFLIAFVLGSTAPAYADSEKGYYQVDLRCESFGQVMTTCPVGHPAARVNTVQLIQQISNSVCAANITYGFTGSSIWVSRGCRGIFRATYFVDDLPPPSGDCTIFTARDQYGNTVYLVRDRYANEIGRSYDYNVAYQILQQARASGRCGGGYPPPPPSGTTCDVMSNGIWGSSYYNFRIATNGQVIYGTNSYETLAAKLQEFERNRVCTVRTEACAFQANGIWGSSYYNFRMSVGGETFYGSNSLETLVEQARNMSYRDRVCSIQPRSSCEMGGSGIWGSSYYNYRVMMGGEAVYGSNSTDAIYSAMSQLRSVGFCY